MAWPESIGPYRVIDLLGKGAMGTVYRAQHETTGAAVALKMLSSPSGTGIAGIRREIHALGRVQHPGVARIVDQGTADGLPWYAMEIIHGHTLRAILDKPNTSEHPTPAGFDEKNKTSTTSFPVITPSLRAIDICVDLCESLAVVHAAGLVHRDLKPENILVTPDGRSVLVDFGIAGGFGGATGREVLAPVGEVIGTRAYMAPEQIRGDLVDARADLYALGCILYECLTGVTPFSDKDASAILRAHLFDTPIAPSARGVPVSPELDALILQLLAKRPADRVGHAADVATILRDLGHASGSAPGARPPPYLYRAELTGRSDIMTRAATLLDALTQQLRGGVVYAGGESGVGKTRLGVEITREAMLRKVNVVTGQCVPAQRVGATPLHPFLPLLHEALRHLLHGGDAQALAIHARVLAPYCPELAPHLEHFPEPPPLAPDAARARVLDAALAVLLAFVRDTQLLLVLDDVHWADELSLALLARLAAARLQTRGLLCICLYRAEDATDPLLALAAAESVERWTLGRLDEASVAQMAAGMLGATRVPRVWTELLARVSGGNPFFAGEYLRAAVDAGILLRDPKGRWLLKAADAARGEALSLPSNIEALLHARLARLNPAEWCVLAAAAVLGRSLEGDVAAAMAGFDEPTALDALSGLAQRQILEEAVDGQLRFVHDRLRDAAYARLDAHERRDLHGRAAAAIEARYPGDAAHFVRLANHHAGAERHDAAYWYATLAANHAAVVYANEQAMALHRAALAAADAGGAADVRRADSWQQLGDLLQYVGQADEAYQAYSKALEYLSPDARTRGAELLLSLGSNLGLLQRHTEALALFAQAAERLGATPCGDDEPAWWRTRIQIGLERILIYYFAGDTDALARVIDDLEPIIEQHASDTQRTRYFQSLVQRDLRGARYRTSATTVRYARRCHAACVTSRDRAGATDTHFSLAAVLLWNDALDDAEQEFLAVLDETEAIGNAVTRVACLAYLAQISRRRGDVDATRVFALRCLSVAEEATIPHYMGHAEAHLGWVHMEDNSLDEAERLCLAALTRWRALPLSFPFQWLARLPLMKCAIELGQQDQALEHAQAMLDVTQQRLPEALETALHQRDVPGALRVAETLGFL